MIGWEVAKLNLKPKFAGFLRACHQEPRSHRIGPNGRESPIRHARLSPSSGPMKFPCTAVASTLVLATALAWLSDGTVSLAGPKSIPLPRPRPTLVARSESAPVTPVALQSKLSAPPAAPTAASGPDFGAVKQALELIRRGKSGEATSIEANIHDPAAKK